MAATTEQGLEGQGEEGHHRLLQEETQSLAKEQEKGEKGKELK